MSTYNNVLRRPPEASGLPVATLWRPEDNPSFSPLGCHWTVPSGHRHTRSYYAIRMGHQDSCWCPRERERCVRLRSCSPIKTKRPNEFRFNRWADRRPLIGRLRMHMNRVHPESVSHSDLLPSKPPKYIVFTPMTSVWWKIALHMPSCQSWRPQYSSSSVCFNRHVVPIRVGDRSWHARSIY